MTAKSRSTEISTEAALKTTRRSENDSSFVRPTPWPARAYILSEDNRLIGIGITNINLRRP